MANYTISTSPEREAALQDEAARVGLTALQTLQFYLDNFLDGKAKEQVRSRANRLSENWERLTPEEKQTVNDLLTKTDPVGEER